MSLKLPRHLAAWEPQLRIFPEEMALALGPLVQKISAVVGPLSAHHSEGHVAPDGFAGLAKRGVYERLIASDWMLADELPEEFMRRSVMGEHLFWKLAYLEPAQSRSTLVLFDAGPEQLGSPRLAHLAALAVFEARARAANANFHWGILQSAGLDVMPGMNVAEVFYLLHARGNLSARPEHFAAWLQHRAETGETGEVWVVGSERLRAFLPESFSSLVVNDAMQPGDRRLLLECRPVGKHPRTIELELPPPQACAQLLRDPFSVTGTPVQESEARIRTNDLVFHPAGRKVFTLTQKGAVMGLPVPNSLREPPGNPRYYPSGFHPVIAIGQAAKRTWVVSVNPDHRSFHVERLGKWCIPATGDYPFQFDHDRATFQSGRLRACFWHEGHRAKRPGLYLLDDVGLLFRIFGSMQGHISCTAIYDRCLAVTQTNSGLCYAGAEESEIKIFTDTHEVVTSFSVKSIPYAAFFGYKAGSGSPVFGLFAAGYTGQDWDIFSATSRTRIKLPEGYSVKGVIQVQGYEEMLIVVEDDPYGIGLLGAHGYRRLHKAANPVVAVSACQRLPLIAFTTAAGDVFVYSLAHNQMLYHFRGSAE